MALRVSDVAKERSTLRALADDSRSDASAAPTAGDIVAAFAILTIGYPVSAAGSAAWPCATAASDLSSSAPTTAEATTNAAPTRKAAW